jgi:hypothetical protein
MPALFKSASFYKNEFGLRVLLDDTDLSPYCFYNSIHKAKEIILSVFDSTELYLIKVYRLNNERDPETLLKSLKEKDNHINYIEHFVQPYEKFEEDFQDFGVVQGLYVLYKTVLTPQLLINLLWDPLAVWFQGSLAFDPENSYDIYFLNLEGTISFHPYDHRGADILCENIEDYRHIFHKLKNNLFEHDLELMRQRLN